MSGKNSVMSKNHCARTSCWWFFACAPHICFVHLPNWHFSLRLPTFQCPGMCAVEIFQRFRFVSLPTSSQEIERQESTITFTFILRTIYKVNGTARYLERCWPATDNDTILTLYLIHTLSLTLYAFYEASNKLIHQTIDPSINTSINQSIHRSIHQLINLSVDRSIDQSIDQCIDRLIHPSMCNPHSLSHTHTLSNSLYLLQGLQSIYPSNHQTINPSINTSINQSIHRSIHRLINPSIHRSFDRSIHRYIDPSIHPSIHRSFNWSIHW